jgi:hypothetical protein
MRHRNGTQEREPKLGNHRKRQEGDGVLRHDVENKILLFVGVYKTTKQTQFVSFINKKGGDKIVYSLSLRIH